MTVGFAIWPGDLSLLTDIRVDKDGLSAMPLASEVSTLVNGLFVSWLQDDSLYIAFRGQSY